MVLARERSSTEQYEMDESQMARAVILTRRARLATGSGVLLAALLVGYAAVLSLARATPALFPGQQLSDAVPGALAAALPAAPKGLGDLVPDSLAVSEPDASSVFNRPIQFLVVGFDRRPDQFDPAAYNTDTILIVSVHPATKEMRVLSIPRDLYIRIYSANGSWYEDRVNSSFGVGAAGGRGFDAGLQQLAGDLEKNLGLRIDQYIAVDIRSAEQLVDAIGGIDVQIPPALAVPDGLWYSNDDRTPVYLYFPPGSQHLDGYSAVAFSRTRSPDDDFQRIQRQQVVIAAIVSRAFSGGFLRNPIALWNAYDDSVWHNVPSGKLPGYALLLKQTQGKVSFFSLADPVAGVDTVSGFTNQYGAAVLRWNRDNARYWVETVTSPAPLPARVPPKVR